MAYKHPILRLADRDILWAIITGLVVIPIAVEVPARFIGKNYRRMRYGSALEGLGRAYAPSPDEGQYKGDFYRDTQHMNAAGNYSKNPSLYVDTRFKTPTSPTPYSSDSGFFDKAGAAPTGKRYGEQPIAKSAPNSLVDLHTGSSVFAGLSGVQKLWGERR
jgi:hypothetical protein